MIYIIQVILYGGNSGCSVRIGRGIDVDQRLEPNQCTLFEFVEKKSEVNTVIKIIEKLPKYYRHIEESLEKLANYLKIRKFKKQNPQLQINPFVVIHSVDELKSSLNTTQC